MISINKSINKLICFFLLIIFPPAILANGLEKHTKFWMYGTITGPVSESNKKIKYLIESRLRLIDDRFLFEHYRLSAGIGYEFISCLTGFAGLGYVIDENTSGVVTHEYRPYQLLKWDVYKSKDFNLANNSLLEERKQQESPGWAYRLREKFILDIPLKMWPKHFLNLSNDFFFNLNHPTWVSPYFFAENRAIIGIATEMSKCSKVMVGYINQYIHTRPENIMSNGLIITFDVTA